MQRWQGMRILFVSIPPRLAVGRSSYNSNSDCGSMPLAKKPADADSCRKLAGDQHDPNHAAVLNS